MAELKTKVNDASIPAFLENIGDEIKQKETITILEMMQRASKTEPKMWGSSIIGFGYYHYVYASGREGDWFLIGLSPRKQYLALYVMGGWDQYSELLAKLGKHSLGKGCLYIRRLSDVNLPILEKLIDESLRRATILAQEDAERQKNLKKSQRQ